MVKKTITKKVKKKQPTKFSKLDKEKLWRMNVEKKKVNKIKKKVDENKLYKIERITNHKCGRRNRKIMGLLIKWEGDEQLTWEKLSVINKTASGIVKEYLESKNLTA